MSDFSRPATKGMLKGKGSCKHEGSVPWHCSLDADTSKPLSIFRIIMLACAKCLWKAHCKLIKYIVNDLDIERVYRVVLAILEL